MSRSRIHREHRRARRSIVRALMQPKLIPPLHAAWSHACWAFANICALIVSPRALASREYISRHEHRRFADLIRNLELLARRIFLAAALMLNLVMKPRVPQASRPHRPKRRVLVWPERPETWVARFSFMRNRRDPSGITYLPGDPTRVVATFALARRMEAVRRVLAKPDVHVRRLAIRLARLAQSSRTANQPFTIGPRVWMPARGNRPPTHGARWIATGMTWAQPVLFNEIDRWNEALDPG